ncbi:MAG: ankyrin repeat domain-containing protein [Spirochaeta sp.]
MKKTIIIALCAVTVILGSCATPERRNAQLMEAVEAGNIDTVSGLLTEGTDPNEYSESGHTPLHAAVIRGNEEIVKMLLDAGADIHAKGPQDSTALALAVLAQQYDMAQYLVQKGADTSPEALNKILFMSLNFKLPVSALYTIEQLGADPSQDSIVLLVALINSQWDMIPVLLEHGADPLIKEGKGRSTLRYAIENPEIVKILVEYGADINNIPDDGVPPLTYAVTNGSEEVVTFLLEQGADPNPVYSEKQENGRTPLPAILPLAMKDLPNTEAIAQLLLSHGADPNYIAVDDNGTRITVLTLSLKNDKQQFTEFLLENGADPNLASDLGSPLELAEASEIDNMTELLESYME